MAVCDWCAHEMMDNETITCTGNTVVDFPDGVSLPSVPYDDEDETRRCHDCNIALGGYHHPGCDWERCPKCGGQLISCGCLDESEETS